EPATATLGSTIALSILDPTSARCAQKFGRKRQVSATSIGVRTMTSDVSPEKLPGLRDREEDTSLGTLRQQIAATEGFVRQMADQDRLGQGLLQLEHAISQFEHALLRQLEFEKFLFHLSRTFIALPEDEIDANMERGLARVGE